MSEYNNRDNPVVWVRELPSSCTECHEPLTDKSFTSKKGEHWDKVVCDNCGIQWIKSKPMGKQPKSKSGGLAESGNAIIMEEIIMFRKEFNERMNSLAEYLSKKLK